VSNMTRHTQVLVIGAGAAGAAATWRLANAGVDVCCLEQGTWVTPEELVTTRADWEIRRQQDWNPNPNVRRLPTDYPIADDSSPIKPLLFNGVGGSTVMWSAHVPRFHPSDFRVRSLDGIGDDWPLTYWDLEPYYDENDRMMGVAGLAGDPANPPRSQRQTPPVPLGEGASLIAGAFDRLGWHWWPSDVAINTAPYGTGRGACNNCGPCELGCVHRAKADTSVTYWPAAISAGAELRTRARVRRVLVDGRGRANGAEYVDADGNVRRVTADAVLICANGIGTPRLLMMSADTQRPNGLANSSGLVGRRLMLHPIAFAVGIFPEAIHGHRGITACSILSQEFYETDRSRGFVRGYELQVLRSHGPLISALGGFGVPVPWGAAHHARFTEVFDHTAGIAVTSEDTPDEQNRVVLTPKVLDSSGLPGARMIYQVDANARAALDHGLDRSEEVLLEAGAREVVRIPLAHAAGFHLMGTARMGEDPERSVVDPWGQSHDVENLFIADGSVFVTAAAVNPTPTLQALALRTADRLLEVL